MKQARSRSLIVEDTTWLPLAFVVAALAVLLVTPIVVNWRMLGLRREIDDRSHARVLLNDLEAAGATQALIAAEPKRPNTDVDTVARQLAETMIAGADDDERQLDSLLRAASPEARSDFAEIASVERAWHSDRSTNAQPNASGPNAARAAQDDGAHALRLFALAERLDKRLGDRLDSARAESRHLQTIDMVAAIVLTPIALLSVLLVFIAGRRARRLARNLAAEREALAQSIEARATLMRGITHDLKNPLGAAVGYADLLLEGVAGGELVPEQSNMVRRIRKLLIDSTATISSMLQLAHDRVESGFKVTVSSVDVVSLVRDVVEDYQAAAAERDLRLELDATPRVAVAITDARHVGHILGNLVSNAVKYTPTRGVVRVRVRDDEHGDALRIEVCDSGQGIPVTLRERVFEEFFRAGTPTAAAGHGVGLAISRRLARLLGGDITVGEAPEGGAQFVFRLPLHAAAAAA
ncbi:MAG TPA: HAMP domain-containing sensor histidine kinase [Gemmatimonadaceae bacterium]|nr:HAMP domain-containing sensor histidine kinase [Gemmatimonadaceae bacterium]